MRERILSVLFLCGNSKVLNKEVATIAKTNDNQMINGAIKFPQVRLIDAEGQMVGVVPIEEALKSAEEADLDLVCISPNPDNPVCRVMDYNKFLFEKGKREKEAKKKQKETELKEVGLKLTTDVHDVEVKRKMVVKFLSAGDRVKVNIRFRGREMAFQNKGFEVLDTFAQSVTEYGSVDRPPKLEGRNMVMYLSPAKKK
jgi:translation initiation factor IF-3